MTIAAESARGSVDLGSRSVALATKAHRSSSGGPWWGATKPMFTITVPFRGRSSIAVLGAFWVCGRRSLSRFVGRWRGRNCATAGANVDWFRARRTSFIAGVRLTGGSKNVPSGTGYGTRTNRRRGVPARALERKSDDSSGGSEKDKKRWVGGWVGWGGVPRKLRGSSAEHLGKGNCNGRYCEN